MKKYFLLFILGLTQCKTVQTDNSKSSVSESQSSAKSYFEAIGIENLWRISIDENQIVFRSLIDEIGHITFDYVKPIIAMDANVKNYKVSNAEWTLEIQISQQDCLNKFYNYKVDLSLNELNEQKKIDYNGCGNYVMDDQLIEKWILEQMEGIPVSTSDFNTGFPYIDIDSEENTFFGFSGCNTMHGQLFFEKDLLRFINIATTRKFCDNNQEPKFLQLLHAATEYKIEQNKLYLSNPEGLLLVFQKMTN